MTDDLDHLKLVMKQATPSPDAARRAANLQLARANFEALNRTDAPTQTVRDRLQGFVLKVLSNGPVLATAVAGVFAVFLIAPQSMDQRHEPVLSEKAAPALAPLATETGIADFAAPAARMAQMDDVNKGMSAAGATTEALMEAAPMPLSQVTLLQTPWNTRTRLLIIASGDETLSMVVDFDPDRVAEAQRIVAPSDGTPRAGTDVSIYEITLGGSQDTAIGEMRVDGRDVQIPIAPAAPDAQALFAAAVAGFGLLRQGQDLGGWDYDDAIALASANLGDDPSGDRAALIAAMRTARDLGR